MLCRFDEALLKREANETAVGAELTVRSRPPKAEAGDHHATWLLPNYS